MRPMYARRSPRSLRDTAVPQPRAWSFEWVPPGQKGKSMCCTVMMITRFDPGSDSVCSVGDSAVSGSVLPLKRNGLSRQASMRSLASLGTKDMLSRGWERTPGAVSVVHPRGPG
jgi:hypothetical protein